MMGIEALLLGPEQVLERIRQANDGGKRLLVVSGNAHFFCLARRHAWLRELVHDCSAEVRVDGCGLVLARRLAGRTCPPRATWADFAWPFGEFCAERGLRPFLLGGAPGIATAAMTRWRRHVPALEFAGCHHGYFDKTPRSRENDRVLRTIARACPDVLLVGFGMPVQERWIRDCWSRLDVPAVLTVGGAFDYVSGALRRPPAWMTGCGLEWLGRWAIEPGRLTRRYFMEVPTFLSLAIAEGIRARLAHGRADAG